MFISFWVLIVIAVIFGIVYTGYSVNLKNARMMHAEMLRVQDEMADFKLQTRRIFSDFESITRGDWELTPAASRELVDRIEQAKRELNI